MTLGRVSIRATYDASDGQSSMSMAKNGSHLSTVCIGRSTYVDDDLKAGRLVAPFDLRLKSDLGFYLVTCVETAHTKKVEAFRMWLIDTIRGSSRATLPQLD